MARYDSSIGLCFALCACSLDQRRPGVERPPLVIVDDVQPSPAPAAGEQQPGSGLTTEGGGQEGPGVSELDGSAPLGSGGGAVEPGAGPMMPPPAPALPPGDCTGTSVRFDLLFAAVATDLALQDPQVRPFLRYVSLTNQVGPGDCPEQLEEERAALIKGLNMLSAELTVQVPVAVNSARTLFRIDLRRYGWDRPLQVGGAAFTNVWEAIAANNPFAVRFVGDDADAAGAFAGTAYPLQFSDQLLHVALAGALYYAIIGVDVNGGRSELVNEQFQIDVVQSLADRESVRAFTTAAGVMGQRAHLVQRDALAIREGVLWQSFALDASTDAFVQQSLFGVPAAGGEAIFTLPNGLLAFVIFDASGNVVPDSDELVDMNLDNFRARSAVSCSSCHHAGLLPVVDLAREHALANALTLGLSREQVAAVELIYPSAAELARVLERDSSGQRAALETMGLVATGRDPVASSYVRFDFDLTLADAAGDLGLGADELEDNLALFPALGVLANGKLDRDDFAALFVDSLCEVSSTENNQPARELCAN